MTSAAKLLLVAVGASLILLASGDDSAKLAARYDPSKPPGFVPWPDGWKRYKTKLLGAPTAEMRAFCRQALANPLGTVLVGGQLNDNGATWGALIEWHFHPPGQGFEQEGWHKGATLITK